MTQHQVFPPPPSVEEALNNPVAMLELREHNSRERLVKVQEANVSENEKKEDDGAGRVLEQAPRIRARIFLSISWKREDLSLGVCCLCQVFVFRQKGVK